MAQRHRRRKAARRSGAATPLPVIDLDNAATRVAALLLLLSGCATVIILAGAGYQGIGVLESVQFCSQACHLQMQPEASAHDRSPHANVACVECHVGPGFGAWVDSKINGLQEMAEVATNTYPRPIPTPIHQLRPARVVCEQCHWPAAFVGDRLIVHTHYGEDAANTPTKTCSCSMSGGSSARRTPASMARRYRNPHPLPGRSLPQTIYVVELTTPDGARKTSRMTRHAGQRGMADMDCLDCHNRPTHIFRDPASR